MTKQKHFRIPQNVSDELDKLPSPRSASARLAILGAAARPELLPMALRLRQYKDHSEDLTRLAIKEDQSVVQALDDLSGRFRLTMEETVRLATEAYIYKL